MNKSNILVSVCMITYNHEKYIAQAIDSVIMQKTNFDYEIVIGEDCSTDRTREIVLEYKTKHPDKIKLLLQEKNVGMMQNFIDTLKACSGKYIALLEGDDYWTDPNKLQEQVDFLEANPEYSMCFTARHIVDEINGIKRNEYYNKNIFTINDIVQNGFISGTQTTVFRNYKDLIYFLKKNSNHPVGDRLLNYYCSLMGNFYCINDITAVYSHNGLGVWSSIEEENRRLQAFNNLCSFYELIGLEKNFYRLAYFGMINFLNSIKQNIKRPLYVIRHIVKWYKEYLHYFTTLINISNFIRIMFRILLFSKNWKNGKKNN